MKQPLIILAFVLLAVSSFADDRPNIVWIIPDDMSAHFSCYGETAIETPHLDALAERGVLFSNAYVTAPVCSTCRSALITGMYQTSIGAHQHRSGRGELKIELPEGVELVPKIFQDAGYHTSITGWPGKEGRFGKTDYNFEWDASVYDGSNWSNREEGQPFFAQVHTPGGKLRGHDMEGWEKIGLAAEKIFGNRISVDQVTLPPYYPDHPDILQDWAAYLDSVRVTDHMIGEVVARLESEGVLDNTIVLFMTDHGISHARGKQFMYDEGLHVPLVVAGPGIGNGIVRDDLVEHIDLAALSLGAAGIEIPSWMQGRDIFADGYEPRVAAFAARDRCDETVDHMRSVRTNQFKYIRNFLPERPYLQPNGYKDNKEIIKALRAWGEEGKLDEVKSLILAETRPPEELYDVLADPHEIKNLADDPAYAETLAELRGQLNLWMEETGDHGREPESEERYDAEMVSYTSKHRKNPESADRLAIIEGNIAQMKKWAAEGK